MDESEIELQARTTARLLRKLHVVNAASLREIRRELSERLRLWSPRQTIELAVAIVELNPPGAYPVVYELIRYHPTAKTSLRATDLRRIGRNMSGWGEVDCVSYLAGIAWRNGGVSDSEIHRWARSTSRWWRRAALVSTVPLNMKSQGGEGDHVRTLAVCSMLLDDRDDMVVKAMSWALRALATREPKRVEGFLKRHEQRLAPRAIREARNKLNTGRKDGRPLPRSSG